MGTERKAPFGVKRIAFATVINDRVGNITFGTVSEMEKDLIALRYTPKTSTGSLSAADQIVDDYAFKSGGSLEIKLTALNSGDEELILGSKTYGSNKVIVSNVNDVIPHVMVICESVRSDGMVNLYKFPKCRLTKQGEDLTSAENGSRTYATSILSGEYIPTLCDGSDAYIIKGVDLKTTEGKVLEEEWFATAEGGIPVSG